MRINEKIRKAGIFWLVESPQEEISGHLTILDGGKVEVEISGLFGGEASQFRKSNDISRVIGKLEDGKLITLDECFYIETQMSFGGISKSIFLSNLAIMGVAYEKDEVPTFNTLAFSVDNLDDWIKISGIKVITDFENRTATISYIPIPKLSFQITDTVRLEIIFSYTIPGSPHNSEAKITQSTLFKIVSDNKITVDELTEFAYKITNFVCFSTDKILSLSSVTVTSTDFMQKVTETLSRPYPINLFYQSLPYSAEKSKIKSNQILFDYSNIKGKEELFLRNWITACDYLSPTLGLYFSVQNGGQKHMEGKFLALAQGLETYHRRTSNEKMMDENEFSKLIDTIVLGCPETHADWLRQRLNHGNEISLRKRMEKIIEPFEDLIGTKKQNKSLVSKIVNTRNYLTHYSEDSKKESVFGMELWILHKKMEAILQLHILKIIGFTIEEIATISKNCETLKDKLNC